jgi:PAS domain S-box-containing protein
MTDSPPASRTASDDLELLVRERTAALQSANDALEKALEAQRRLAETLQANRRLLGLCVDHAPAPIAMLDREMRYVAFSRRWLTDYGISAVDLVGRSHYDVFPEISEHWKQIHRRCLGGAVETCDEDPFTRADGHIDWLRWEIHPWRGEDGTIGGIIIFSENITGRKRGSMALQALNLRLEQEALAREAQLRERETLLQEIQHRVKNNLQVICSLVSMQMRRVEDPAVRTALHETQSRIETIARIHDVLHQSTDHANVPFAAYTKNLVARAIGAAGTTQPATAVTFGLQDVCLPVDKALPCALILNELVESALRQAARRAARPVHIELRPAAGQRVLLAVNGAIGSAADVAPGTAQILGMQLVDRLVAQLGGTLQVTGEESPAVEITFPVGIAR